MLTFAKQAADQERWDEALNWLNQAEGQDRLNPQIHYLRALVQVHQDQSDSAFLSLRQAIYCDPNFALAHYTLAEMYQQRGELKEAVRHLRLTQRAIASLPPDHRLSFSDDLTVEMLHELLTHRLRNLPEARYVAL
jgi:chemotaxis protein methyltransferase CheR